MQNFPKTNSKAILEKPVPIKQLIQGGFCGCCDCEKAISFSSSLPSSFLRYSHNLCPLLLHHFTPFNLSYKPPFYPLPVSSPPPPSTYLLPPLPPSLRGAAAQKRFSRRATSRSPNPAKLRSCARKNFRRWHRDIGHDGFHLP